MKQNLEGLATKDHTILFSKAGSCKVVVTTVSSNNTMESEETKTKSGLLKDDQKLGGMVLGGLTLVR